MMNDEICLFQVVEVEGNKAVLQKDVPDRDRWGSA